MTIRQRISDAERLARLDLAACYRLVARYGMADLIYNHITVRVPGEAGHILINPFGYLYEEITASCLYKIDLAGNVVDKPGDVPYEVNQAGYVIHSAIHSARHDIACVLHTHTRAGMAVATMECGLMPATQGALRFHDRIAYHAFEGPAVDEAERERLVADLGDKDVMILRNHGLLVAGVSVEHGFRELHGLERACNIQIAAQAAGNDNLLFAPNEAIEKVQQQIDASRGGHDSGIQLHWNALIRQLDREGDDYKQ